MVSDVEIEDGKIIMWTPQLFFFSHLMFSSLRFYLHMICNQISSHKYVHAHMQTELSSRGLERNDRLRTRSGNSNGPVESKMMSTVSDRRIPKSNLIRWGEKLNSLSY